MTLNAVILAAGKGTRMKSALPKVLHPIANKPMVQHVIDVARQVQASALHIVYGHGAELLQQRLAHNADVAWALQAEQLGTGHAVMQAMPAISDDATVLVLYGDVPLTLASTLQRLLAVKPERGIGLLTVNLLNPTGYGRILRNQENQVIGIVEQKDANEQQLAITEVNTGIMVVNASLLKGWLAQLQNNNSQGEYYLTDIIAMANRDGLPIQTAHPDSAIEVEGANNRVQLAALERAYQSRQAEQLMLNGATLADPARVDVRGNVVTGNDVFIDINVIFEGNVQIGNNVVIGAGCVLKDCAIADNTVLKPFTLVEDAKVAEDCTVGPFARLRPGAELHRDAHVGNFVELKKTVLGEGSKANHLAYLGDAVIGKKVNIGAGTITCNYDGVNKFNTRIDDGAFIGTNSSLVAPIHIAAMATVGAGSVITTNVAESQLAVARGKQRNIDGWKRPTKIAK